MAALGLLALRLTLGTILAAHGAHDLFGTFAGPGIGPGGLTATATYFTSIGLTPAWLFAVGGGVVQLGGGALIGVGLFTRWAAPVLIVYLGLVVWKDHARWGLFLNWVGDATRGHGMEYSLVVAGALACLTLGGAGTWSLDGLFEQSAAARAAGRARLRARD